MDLDTVFRKVAEIALLLDDNEIAHAKEDRLYLDVLKAIANGCKNPEKLAEIALTTQNLDFTRWTL